MSARSLLKKSFKHCGILTVLFLATAGAAAPAAGQVAQSLNIAKHDLFGSPTDVGLLVLGHSTSAVGDWPEKLVKSLNATANDGRNYVVFRAITGGDGGFLWTQLQYRPDELQYNRVLASQSGTQWCEDSASRVRYSCRRQKLEWAFSGADPVPATSSCSSTRNATVAAACRPRETVACVWHENGQRSSGNLSFKDCWAKMDAKLALIQDTTNRSWPVDDYTGDGLVNAQDYFKASAIRNTAAYPCPATSANPAGTIRDARGNTWIDWTCDNVLNGADAATNVYAGWLKRLSLDLLNSFGATHVFITPKPLEMTSTSQCVKLFPGETCSFHTPRTPTLSRPYSYFYLPSVYWENRPIETLFSTPGLDTRIHLATPGNAKSMWNRSVKCYETGIVLSDWAIRPGNGRPDNIAADNSEIDGTDDTQKGCIGDAEHVHHNDNGGWMMADVWYAGLLQYLR